MNDLKRLIGEIHRRSVWQVLTLYLAMSWVALQVVQTVVESANLPDWLPALALVLLIIGFPVVVATAFVQHGAPGLAGGRPPADTAPSDTAAADAVDDPDLAHRSGDDRPTDGSGGAGRGVRSLLTWRNAILGGVGAFALWGVIAAFLVSTGRPIGPAALEASERPSVAVLPLAALAVGTDDDDAFARGFHDEIITRLSKIGGLRVTSRTSVMEYAGQAGNMRDIARDLGVDLLLEGSIQRTDGQLALNIQLIDGRTDEHLWAESYNREYSLASIFSIQRQLAEEIARELRMSMSPEESSGVAEAPTSNAEAYQTYVQANDFYWAGPRSDDFEVSIQLYERAVEHDPDFALAHARLAFALGQWWQTGASPSERTETVEDRARGAVARALELDPDLPEAYLAQGQLQYAIDRNYGLAMASLTRASGTGLKGDYYHLLGAAQRRLGDFEGAVASWEEMVGVDPLSVHYAEDLASVYHMSGRLDDAEAEYRRAIDLDPMYPGPYGALTEVLLAREGSTGGAWEILERAERQIGDTWAGTAAWLHYLDRDFERALETSQSERFRAGLLFELGRTEEARVLVSREERDWEDQPEAAFRDAYVQIRGAELAVVMGDPDTAARRAEEAIRLLPPSADAVAGPDILAQAATLFARMGRGDRALDLLEELAMVPSAYPAKYMALQPTFDGIRDEPRFQALLGG